MFKAVWRRCTGDEEYLRLKREFQEEQKAWDKKQKGVKKEEEEEEVEIKQEPVVKKEDIDDG